MPYGKLIRPVICYILWNFKLAAFEKTTREVDEQEPIVSRTGVLQNDEFKQNIFR
ncbi:hypothetical protein LOAG_06285 [Loa loa]|uniref:Uncharacterized protein n=1 Tax=Loa loa TaxID=7209 RepID=A0A1S0TZU6_LOALO|nr:hypothetical protein LOAG_06285 [Loa loa]EFO22204.1 hypothetical protein LOAG_06285 [Loa loa]